MYRSYPRTTIIAIALTVQIASSSAWAASFTVNNGVTDTVAKTLGSTAGQTGTVNATGTLTVSGSTVAITITGNSATLSNDGTIKQTGSGRLIRDNTGVTGLLINNGSIANSAALMQSADADVIQMNKPVATVTLNNYGTMTSLNASAGGSQAVDFYAITGANTVNNFATGIMQASQADAVRPGVNGLVNNSGTIKSTSTTDSSSDGVDVQDNTGVTIVNANNWTSATPLTPGTGLIEGARHGITGGPTPDIAFTTTVTNNFGGTIKGDNGSGINLDGFSALQTATIINNGTITGNGHEISGFPGSRDGDGIDVDGIAYITNTGIIRSINAFAIPADGVAHSEGITIGGGTIINSGTIEGLVAPGNTNAVGRGISFLGNDITTGPLARTREAIYGNAVVTNNAGGLIRGDSDSAIAVEGPASVSGFTVQINNNSGAAIQGGGATNAAIWVRSDNVPTNPDITVMNQGTIDGSSSGKAIALGQGNDIVQLFGGTVIGTIDGGLGTNTLQTNGTQTFAGGTIFNFQNLNVLGGTTSMNGTNTFTNGTTVASGGTLIVGLSEVDNNAQLVSNVIVSSGATLAGHGGIVGSVTNNGTIAPGNSPGTLHLAGTITMNPGSTHAVDIDGLGTGNGAGNYDRLLITGAGNNYAIGTDVTLVSKLRGITPPADNTFVPSLGDTFRIVTAEGGITGRFSVLLQPAVGLPADTRLYAFYNIFGSNSVDLRLIPMSWKSYLLLHGGNENAQSAGDVLDILAASDTAGSATVKQQELLYSVAGSSAALLPDLTNKLSGQVHAAMAAEVPLASFWLQSTVEDLLAMTPISGKCKHAEDGFWMSASRNWEHGYGDESASTFKANRNQYAFGFDMLTSKTARLGIGYSYANIDVRASLDESGTVTEQQAFLYGQAAAGKVVIEGIASVGPSLWETTRPDPLGLTVTPLVTNDTGLTGMAGVTVRVPMKRNCVSIQPFASAIFVHNERRGLSEGTSTPAALNLTDYTLNGNRFLAGVSFGSEARNPMLIPSTFSLTLSGGFDSSELANPHISATLADTSFTIVSPSVSRTFFQSKAGATLRMAKEGYCYINYSMLFRNGANSQGLEVGAKLTF